MTAGQNPKLTPLVQARHAGVPMLIATTVPSIAIAMLAEGQASTRLLGGSGESTCISVSKSALTSIRATGSESPITTGKSAAGCVVHVCNERVRHGTKILCGARV